MEEKIIIQCPDCKSKIRIPKGKYVTFECNTCGNQLEFDDRTVYKKLNQSKSKKIISSIVIYLLTLIIAVPILIILNQFLPLISDGFYKYERAILFIFICFLLSEIFKKFNNLILLFLGSLLIFLTYGTFKEGYGFQKLFFDYKSLVYSINKSPKSQVINFSNLKSFKNKEEIVDAIDYRNPLVRDFSHKTLNDVDCKSYQDYCEYIQYFAVFKRIEENWKDVKDPKNEEYYSKASETFSRERFSGDCDDYAIAIAAAIKSIGGTVRLVRTKGHLYPELFISNRKELENISYLITEELFKNEIDNNVIYYHEDESGGFWLNLDYTADYPGGKFMHEEILGILNL